jgi:hypothetical protein
MSSTSPWDRWAKFWSRSANRWEEFSHPLRRATGWRIWNPGIYGGLWHRRFLARYPPSRHPLVVFGLNPGPYGMAQTGIPFTDVKRLVTALPALARELVEEGIKVEVPGLAPTSLRPYLDRTFESSSVRVYRFLRQGWGSAERGWRAVVVANPCSLLFIDPEERKNRTPADFGRTVRARKGNVAAREIEEESNRLRSRCALEALEALDPRGAILLGKDVESVLAPRLIRELGPRRVVAWEHPARAVPERWAAGLLGELRCRGLFPDRRRNH